MTSVVRDGGARVLVVCTGNVCRSPAGELLLAAGLLGTGVTVASAGTRALAGEPVHPPMARLLAGAGLDPSPFTARQLQAAEVRSADLVLVMARDHRAAVATTVPAAVRRVLLLTDAAAVAAAVASAGWPGASADPGERLAALPALAARSRATGGAGGADVPDPYRRAEERYAESFGVVAGAVDTLVGAVLTRHGG
ncbi:arsenate reductase/protein-tyrosine-phosphatase family protein [Geodermatophilus sp. SYSU D01119]